MRRARGHRIGGDRRARDGVRTEVASGWLREDTVARLERHRALGHAVILASASLDPYLVPLGASLGVDGVVCTGLERGPDGRLTGRLAGANCRARRRRAGSATGSRGAGLADAELWAYGDSSGDDELLALADHPLRVDGDPRRPRPIGVDR